MTEASLRTEVNQTSTSVMPQQLPIDLSPHQGRSGQQQDLTGDGLEQGISRTRLPSLVLSLTDVEETRTEVLAWSSGKVAGEDEGLGGFNSVRKVPKNVKQVLKKQTKKTSGENKNGKKMAVVAPKLTERQKSVIASKKNEKGASSALEKAKQEAKAEKEKSVEASKKRFAETLARERPGLDGASGLSRLVGESSGVMFQQVKRVD